MKQIEAQLLEHKRLLCFLLAVTLVFSFVSVPQVQAFALVDDILILLAAFAASCGAKWLVTENADFLGMMERSAQAFLDETTGGGSLSDWLGPGASNISIAKEDGKLKIRCPSSIAEKFSTFTNWLFGKKGIVPGGEAVEIAASKTGFTLADGTFIALSGAAETGTGSSLCTAVGTLFEIGESFKFPGKDLWFGFANDSPWYKQDDGTPAYYAAIFSSSAFSWSNVYKKFESPHYRPESEHITFVVEGEYLWLAWYELYASGAYIWKSGTKILLSLLGLTIDKSGAISLAPSDTVAVPDTTDKDKDKDLVISTNVPAVEGTDSDLLQQILDAIKAGDLAATNTAVKAEEVPGEITDVDDLGLPSLSAIITTRFPFSIPWDIVSGIKLVAAPAKAPYWEVDFLSVLSDKVGGWEGDTTVVIDMGKFPLVGQLTRWASTIGFCLLLAAGTKKLVWTA